MRNDIKQFIERGRWQYNYSSHMNGSVQLESKNFSLIEQKRQQSLADLICNIKSGIQTTLNRITLLESEITSLSNTLNKRRHLDGGYNGDSIIMKRRLNTKEQEVKRLYQKIENDHNRLIRNLELNVPS